MVQWFQRFIHSSDVNKCAVTSHRTWWHYPITRYYSFHDRHLHKCNGLDMHSSVNGSSRYIPARDRIPLVSMQLTGTWNLRETCKIFSWRMRITRYHQKSNDHLETVLVQVQGPFDWHAAEKASLSWMHNSRPLMTGPTSRASSLHLLLSIHWYVT